MFDVGRWILHGLIAQRPDSRGRKVRLAFGLRGGEVLHCPEGSQSVEQKGEVLHVLRCDWSRRIRGFADSVRAKWWDLCSLLHDVYWVLDRLAAWFWPWCGVWIAIGITDDFFEPLGYTKAVVAVVYF